MTSGRARQLRRNQTDAERQLWFRLRDRQLAGHKFRRQVALGTFVVDFLCFDARIVVELDGGQHGDSKQQASDHARTTWLASQGYRILRFWNHEILDNMEGVLVTITEALHDR
jgi:very-short-patch-repair endonuclease